MHNNSQLSAENSPTTPYLSTPFWQAKTIQEIALAQGVQPIKNADVLIGGWPEEELDDHFEETLEKKLWYD